MSMLDCYFVRHNELQILNVKKFQFSDYLSSSLLLLSTTNSSIAAAAAAAAAFALFIEEEVVECLLQFQVLRCMLFPSCTLFLVLDAGERLNMLRQQAPPSIFEYPGCTAETGLQRDSIHRNRHNISSHNRQDWIG